METLAVDAVAVVAVATGGDGQPFAHHPTHPAEASGAELLVVELHDRRPLGVVEATGNGLVNEQRFAEFAADLPVFIDLLGEFHRRGLVGMGAKHIGQRGVGPDVSLALHCADEDRLAGTTAADCGGDPGEPLKLVFVLVAFQIGGLRFVAEVPD